MRQDITWVALDTSKKKHVVAVLDPGSDEVREWTIPNEIRAIRRFARRLVREAPGEVRVCYEAGPVGYALKRQLEEVADLVCEVIAPALIPIRPGKRIKTDRRDARDLVQWYRSGSLTVVDPPTEAEESVRDLMRCRECAKTDLLRARHRLSKYLLRRGRVYLGRSWTHRHEKWLASQVWEHETDEDVFGEYRLAVGQIEERIRVLDARIEEVSEDGMYREAVGWLRCYRGLDTVTAMTILAEIHGFRRFHSARQLMSYLGMVPSEDSSGDRRYQGCITKAGNRHVRRVLIEAAWHSRHRPAVGVKLRKRREGQPAWVIAHADRAMVRLHHRYKRLSYRGKPRGKVVTAVARELVGFIWAMLREGDLRRDERSSGKASSEKRNSAQVAA
jgi:transposase